MLIMLIILMVMISPNIVGIHMMVQECTKNHFTNYSCKGVSLCCRDRCYPKLKNKKWSVNDYLQEIGNSYIFFSSI